MAYIYKLGSLLDYKKDSKLDPRLLPLMDALADYLDKTYEGAFGFTHNGNGAFFIADSDQDSSLYKKIKMPEWKNKRIYIEFNFRYYHRLQFTALGVNYSVKTWTSKKDITTFITSPSISFDADKMRVGKLGYITVARDIDLGESITIKKDIRIPSTNLILEKGDRVYIKEK